MGHERGVGRAQAHRSLRKHRPDAILVAPTGGKRLRPLARSLIVVLLTFVSALGGFLLQGLLPVQYVADAKGMIGSIIGLVTFLLALALGLLIWTSYGVYTNQNADSQSLGPLILSVDFALERYGPEASRGRELLRAAAVRARDRFWGRGGRAEGVSPYAQARADLHAITAFFAGLEPATEQQKEIITTAVPNFMQVVERTLLMTRQLANPTPKLLLYAAVGWSALLLMSYGLLGAFNLFSVAIQAIGSIAVASAVFIILEFSRPYPGLFRISPVGVDNLIAELGR
jgi:hypothetical protein